MTQETLRLTTQQRLAALERENVALLDRVSVLHNMLKQQRQLINEYITQTVLVAGEDRTTVGNAGGAEALYTFVCRQRFERVEKRLDKLREDTPDCAARRRAV